VNLSDQGLFLQSDAGSPSGAYWLTGFAGGPFSQWAYPAHVWHSFLARTVWVLLTWCSPRSGWLVRTDGGLEDAHQARWMWVSEHTGDSALALRKVEVRMAGGSWRLLRLHPLHTNADRTAIPRWVLLKEGDLPSLWQLLLCTLQLGEREASRATASRVNVPAYFQS